MSSVHFINVPWNKCYSPLQKPLGGVVILVPGFIELVSTLSTILWSPSSIPPPQFNQASLNSKELQQTVNCLLINSHVNHFLYGPSADCFLVLWLSSSPSQFYNALLLLQYNYCFKVSICRNVKKWDSFLFAFQSSGLPSSPMSII